MFFQTRKWPLLTEVTMTLHSNSIGKERCQKEKIKFTNPNTTKCICTFLNFKIKNCLMFQNCASQISTRPPKGMTKKRSNLSNPPSKDGNKMHDEKPLQKIRISKLNNGRRRRKKISLGRSLYYYYHYLVTIFEKGVLTLIRVFSNTHPQTILHQV